MRRPIHALAVGSAVALGLAATLALSGCARHQTALKPAVPPALAAVRPVTAVVLADSSSGGEPTPRARTIWIVSLDGRVTKRTVPAQFYDQRTFPLSPDGRALLYADGSLWPHQTALRLRELDLDTGKDRVVIAAAPLVWGWDTTGRIVAVTANRAAAPGFGTASLRDVTLWRGEAGHLETAALEPTAAPIDITSFIAADTGAAYFGGSTTLGLRGPSEQHVWRYDFARRRLELTFSHEGMRWGLGSRPGDTGSELALGGIPTHQDALTSGLRMNRYTIVYVTTANGFGYQPMISGVDVLRLSDMRVVRSIAVTPTPTLGAPYYPLFNADFSRYLITVPIGREPQYGARSEPRNVAQVEVAGRRVEPVSSPPSLLAVPLGYLGSSQAFVYRGVDGNRVAVFLKEPGAAPRVILRLGQVRGREALSDGSVLLGVQYAK